MKKFVLLLGMVLLSIQLVSAQSSPPQNSLVAFFTFDSDQATTNHVYDYYNNSNGTITGAVINNSGILNDGFYFDGTDDNILLSSNYSFSNGDNLSISLWVYPESIATESYYISDISGSGWFIEQFNSKIWSGNSDGGVNYKQEYTDNTVTSNAWYHVVVVYHSNGEIDLYVDGTQHTNVSNGGTLTSSQFSGNAFILGETVAGIRDYLGLIDEVAIFNSALTQENAIFLYNSGAPGANQRPPYYQSVNVTNLVPVNGSVTSINGLSFNFSATNYENNNFNCSLYLNGTEYFGNTSETNYTVTIDSGNYSFSNLPINSNTTYEYYASCTDGFSTTGTETNTIFTYDTALVVNFFDEITLNPLNNITLEYIGNEFSGTLNTTSSIINITNLGIGEYHLRYSSNNYILRDYWINITSIPFSGINLYLLNDSVGNNVTIELLDNFESPLTDYYIKLQRYYLEDNTFRTVEIVKTNYFGEEFLSAQLFDELYKIVITDGEKTFLSTSSFKISETTLVFQINPGTLVGSEYEKTANIVHALSFENTTNEITFLWDDTKNEVTQGCLAIYKISLDSKTLVNSSCVSSSGGSITLGVENITTATYEGLGSVYYSNTETTLNTILTTVNENTEAIFGTTALLLVIIIAIELSFIGMISPAIMILMQGVWFTTTKIIGFHALPWGVVLLVDVVCIIAVFIIGDR